MHLELYMLIPGWHSSGFICFIIALGMFTGKTDCSWWIWTRKGVCLLYSEFLWWSNSLVRYISSSFNLIEQTSKHERVWNSLHCSNGYNDHIYSNKFGVYAQITSEHMHNPANEKQRHEQIYSLATSLSCLFSFLHMSSSINICQHQVTFIFA